ncbi:MAG: LolA family protein [Thermodesulfobacteriota bacterium]
MKDIFVWMSLSLMLGSFAFYPSAFGLTAQEVLAEIQNQYEKTNDSEANFIQEYIGKTMKGGPKGEGKVYFKKKGMMRWDYRVPNQKIISNGQTFWFYLPDDHQVMVSDVSKVIQEKTPLAFLSGEGNLTRDFNLVHFNESVSPKENYYVIELAPKDPQVGLFKLSLTVDKRTYYILQADVVDAMGNATRTRFLDIKTNLNLPDSLFLFTIPAGVEVLKIQEPSLPSPSDRGRPTAK